ncbi:17517_t:CDS:1, partial [Racocetra fulgida]
FEFRIKQISVVGINNKTLSQIYKFLYLIQQLIVTKVCIIEKRIENDKKISGLTSLNCFACFFA